ncbi:MAG: CoA transferase [Candidatus Binataceae bacterium]|nr:CoA transferase [Candidatus Binataceae bacterium]
MADKELVNPPFGPLQGVRILSSGSLIAGPFGAELAAEMGAEVIQVERVGTGDRGWRQFGPMLPARAGLDPVSTTWAQERRNVFCVTLDPSLPRGREIFLKLAARAEIWIENSKARTWDKWGLDDATVWALNPQLVITHVSGFGQTGDPEFLKRPSYDYIGQAMGGIMDQTGFPDPHPPTRGAPWLGDYITALFSLWSSLAGLTYARATGKGQAIDLAQYEAIHRLLGGTMIEYFERGIIRERLGNKARDFQPGDTFQCRDGWIVIAALAGEPYDNILRTLGLDPADDRWQRARTQPDSPDGIEFDRRLRDWLRPLSVEHAVPTLNAMKVASSPVLNARAMAEHPQYGARGVHVQWDDEVSGPIRGIGVIPRFSQTPGGIFRGSVPVGHDNHRVYRDLLGLGDAEIQQLQREHII